MLEPVLVQLTELYPEDVRLVSRYFPLSFHANAFLAAQGAEAAGAQGKYFEMSELIFAEQATWVEMTTEDFTAWLTEQAGTMGLDTAQFTTDLNSDATKARIQSDLDEGAAIGVPGTPYLSINGIPYEGQRSLDILTAIVELIKLEDKQYSECPAMTVDTSATYLATIKTDKGDIVMELYPDKAPLAVNSFIFLAENGWFDNTTFHRVLEGFVAQGGDPTGTGAGGPGYAFGNEISDLMFDKEGVVGMANGGPDSNGCQFFITYAAAPDLDGRYTIFGQVVEGMDVVKSLTVRDPSDPATASIPGDVITSITIEKK
jgi:cyclophilin family peptidyl-prolyl cis-trans isomerase